VGCNIWYIARRGLGRISGMQSRTRYGDQSPFCFIAAYGIPHFYRTIRRADPHSRLARRQISRDSIRANARPEVGRRARPERTAAATRRVDGRLVSCKSIRIEWRLARHSSTHSEMSVPSTSECTMIATSLFSSLLLLASLP